MCIRDSLLNSGSSSKNKTPKCARLISPGRGVCPPPTKPASDIVWCGERKGRTAISISFLFKEPATENTLVTSIASLKERSGRIVGNLLASILLPEPGGPIIRTCLLYTSDAADDLLCVDLGGRR